MTTAHRPTFHNAIGGDNQGGNFLVTKTTKLCARDLPGQTTLKTRHAVPKPLYSDDVNIDATTLELHKEQQLLSTKGALKDQLEERERQHQAKKAREKAFNKPLEALADVSVADLKNYIPSALLPDQEENPFPEDSDDEGPADKISTNSFHRNEDDSNSSEAEDDDEEEEEALLRELEKIKKDREEIQRQKDEELAKIQAVEDKARIFKANPLMTDGLKRRWDDDVVFRNQAKDIPKPKKRFINDSVRSDFHRKFLAKYIQ